MFAEKISKLGHCSILKAMQNPPSTSLFTQPILAVSSTAGSDQVIDVAGAKPSRHMSLEHLQINTEMFWGIDFVTVITDHTVQESNMIDQPSILSFRKQKFSNDIFVLVLIL